MTFAQMKKLMPNATDAEVQAALDAVLADTKTQIETETSGLLANKTKLLTQMDKLKNNQIPDGYDAEGYATYTKEKGEFAKKQKDLADAELEGKGQWEALKLQLNETHTVAINKLTEDSTSEIDSLRKALDKELIENNAIKAIETEKGNSLFLLPHMRGQMKTVKDEATGAYSVQVLDKEGNQRFGDDATTPFTVKDLVAEFKANDIYGPAFPNLNSGGGDPNVNGKGGATTNPWKADTKNITEQARLTKENPTLATQLKKAAGVQ